MVYARAASHVTLSALAMKEMAVKNRTDEVIICLGKCTEMASDLLHLWHEKTSIIKPPNKPTAVLAEVKCQMQINYLHMRHI